MFKYLTFLVLMVTSSVLLGANKDSLFGISLYKFHKSCTKGALGSEIPVSPGIGNPNLKNYYISCAKVDGKLKVYSIRAEVRHQLDRRVLKKMFNEVKAKYLKVYGEPLDSMSKYQASWLLDPKLVDSPSDVKFLELKFSGFDFIVELTDYSLIQINRSKKALKNRPGLTKGF